MVGDARFIAYSVDDRDALNATARVTVALVPFCSAALADALEQIAFYSRDNSSAFLAANSSSVM